MSSTSPPIETEALVIGAGPVGLFQVFELGLQEIQAHVVDVLPYVGGQCMALYADKPIYDIPGLPHSTGRELIERLQQQASPFKPVFHLNQLIHSVQQQADKRWLIGTSSDASFLAKTVFIAAGVGAFTPRKLALPELDAFEGKQVFYTASGMSDLRGKHLVVTGGDDLALQTALDALALAPASVTLVHRRSTLDAEEVLLKAFHAAVAAEKIHFITAQISHTQSSTHELTGLQLQLIDGSTRQVTCDLLLIQLGISPQLGPLADWGLDMARKQLTVNTEDFSTSAPGIFAVGDINTYPGKRKLIVSGFHEATLAAFGAATYLRPGQKIPLEYTTASPRLHRLLGV
jgi:thioredoxin reductase (NADPH)